MNLNDFYRALRKFRGQFVVLSNGHIRHECDDFFCPLAAVGNTRDIILASKNLGLSAQHRSRIILAADNNRLTEIERRIRRSLLKALGLPNDTESSEGNRRISGKAVQV